MGRVADGGVACITDNCRDPDPEDYACQDIIDASGRAPVADVLGPLADPLARLILKRPGECPGSYEELVAKLELEDRSRCAGGPRASMLGRVISERGQLLGREDRARVVVSRTCARREAYELMFAIPEIDTSRPELPTAVEVMAFDDSSDAYNFYSLTGSVEVPTWTFHGNSLDIVAPANTDAEAPSPTCGSCHTDGGLIMREISDPWLHWESAVSRTAGAAEILDRFEVLGGRGNGPELEQVIRAGNAHLGESKISKFRDEARVDLHDGSLRELLRPLFCATAINTASAGGPDGAGTSAPVRAIPGRFFADPMWQPLDDAPVTRENYEANLDAIGSRIDGVVGARDTSYGFTFVERSAADVAYVQRLIELRLIDEEFALDVLSIDFTRPVFSDDRCALLDFVPDFAGLDAAPEPPPSDAPVMPSSDCCDAHPSPGCADELVRDCVCAEDEFCCSARWDQTCVNLVTEASPACGICSAEAQAPEGGLAGEPPALSDLPEAANIRRAMFARLAEAELAPDSAAATLRFNLQTPGQASTHRARVSGFVEACRDRSLFRDQPAFLRDVSETNAARRLRTTELTGALDTPGAIATDDLDPMATVHLDPISCELAF